MGRGWHRRDRDALGWGVMLIAMGGFFLMTMLGILPHAAWRTWWPAFVLVPALGSLVTARDPSALGSAVNMLGIGAWLLISANDWLGLGWSRSWPLALVAIGLGAVTEALAAQLWRPHEGEKEDGHVA
jgi:hypothetical protein